ncbi:MAG: MGMT family protein, partial [Desulfurococcaceae archaeon]
LRSSVKRRTLDDIYREILYILLQLIPMGKVVSYSNLAKILSIHPRKIAYYLKTNENPIIIPCHRVVASNRELGGYSLGGLEMKKKLLLLEGVVLEDNRVSRKSYIDLYGFLNEDP